MNFNISVIYSCNALGSKFGIILDVYVRGDLGEVQSPYGRGIGTETPWELVDLSVYCA